MNTKLCPQCMTVKDRDEFGPNRARSDGLQSYCRVCFYARRKTAEGAAAIKVSQRAWYLKNSDSQLARKKAEYEADIDARRAKAWKVNRDPIEYERHRVRVMQRHQVVKKEVFAAYGGFVCVCCGEDEPRFLSIDHIEGCGKELRKLHGLGSRFYNWLRTNNFPPGFQVLCFNCNMGRALNGGICPHKVPVDADEVFRLK